MNKQQILEADKQNYMPVFSRYPVVLSHGEGPYVFDVDGKKYIDFLAGIAVNVLGHGHPALVGAIAAQAGKMIHCSNLYYTEQQAKLAARLAALSGLERVFIGNSGAEANEGAIKLARKYGKKIAADKVEIVSMEHSFHGRTLATLTATAQPKYQKGYEPLPQGFKYVPFNNLAALTDIVSDKTCAVMLEAVQGEGGIHIGDQDYLNGVRELCSKYDALLIIDEIQSGMGRTGKMFAYQHYGVMPDIITLAKGLAGGVPIGAFLAREEVAQVFNPGDHGTTFGGNPLACAAANAVLDVMETEGLPANAQVMGQYLMEQLEGLAKKHAGLVSGVRGRGLMVGMQLKQPGAQIVVKCMELGALINCTAGDVLRFVPPLIINKQHVDELTAILDQALANFA